MNVAVHQVQVLVARLSPREQRLVAIFASLVAAVLVWSLVVAPFLGGRETMRREIDGLRGELSQLDSLAKQIRQTESTLRGDESDLGFTTIRAPMAGTVVLISAKVGQTLNATQQAPVILKIADLSTMTVETQVSEADVSKLRVGMEAYVTTLGGMQERRFSGTLRQVRPRDRSPSAPRGRYSGRAFRAVIPPSTTSVAPVTYDIAGSTRLRIACASSSGWP